MNRVIKYLFLAALVSSFLLQATTLFALQVSDVQSHLVSFDKTSQAEHWLDRGNTSEFVDASKDVAGEDWFEVFEVEEEEETEKRSASKNTTSWLASNTSFACLSCSNSDLLAGFPRYSNNRSHRILFCVYRL